MENTKTEQGETEYGIFEYDLTPEAIQKYKENNILNPDGGELLGIINSFKFIKNHENENTIELYISVYGFRPDGKILNNIIKCQLPMKNITFFLDGKQFNDVFSGILEWGTWMGAERLKGLFVIIKYEFDEQGLIVREIKPCDNSCKIVSSDKKYNTDVYLKSWKNLPYLTKTGELFQYVYPYSVKVESVSKEKFNLCGSCGIGEFPPITKNEIKNIIGEPLVGNFDKTVNEWLTVVTITRESDIEGDDKLYSEQYLFKIYDYKHPKIKDDELFEYHIGCGWRVDEDDNKEYKSPFEKAFALADEHKKGRFGNVCDIFTMYIYNEILKMRKNKQQ